MTRPGGVPAAWSSGDPTIATSGATFVVGQQWGTWDGALAVATLKGVSLHLFSVNSANATARAAAPAQPVREATSTVIEAKDVTTGDSPAADGEAATAPADATARGSADPIGTGLEGVFGRLRTAQLGPDGALYLTTSNDNNQDKILRVQASRRRTPPADNPTPSGVALLRTEVATTAFVRGTDDAVWFRRTDRSVGYDTLWGAIQFGPAAVSPAGDLLDVFAVGTDGGLYHESGSTCGPWSGWESLGGQLTATPSAVSVSADRIDGRF